MANVNFINGGVDPGNRAEPTNYSNGQLPTADDDVTQTTASATGSVTCKSWTNGNFVCGGAGTITGNFVASGTGNVDAITVQGNFTYSNATCQIGNIASVTVNGNFTQSGGAALKRATINGTYTHSSGGLTATVAVTVRDLATFGSNTALGAAYPAGITPFTFNGGVKITAFPGGGGVMGNAKAIDAGAVTGITNLAAGNIKKNVTIANVTGDGSIEAASKGSSLIVLMD